VRKQENTIYQKAIEWDDDVRKPEWRNPDMNILREE
jgi:hypothetical protein